MYSFITWKQNMPKTHTYTQPIVFPSLILSYLGVAAKHNFQSCVPTRVVEKAKDLEPTLTATSKDSIKIPQECFSIAEIFLFLICKNWTVILMSKE